MSLGLNMVFFIWKVLLHFISSCPNNSILFQSKKLMTITQQCKTCRVIISIDLGNGLAFTRFQATTWSNDHYAYIQFSLLISFIPVTVAEYIISYAIHHPFQPSYIPSFIIHTSYITHHSLWESYPFHNMQLLPLAIQGAYLPSFMMIGIIHDDTSSIRHTIDIMVQTPHYLLWTCQVLRPECSSINTMAADDLVTSRQVINSHDIDYIR